MGSLDHILTGFTLGLRHRRALGALLGSTSANSCILELDPNELCKSGIRVLALDFDGVLSPHGFQAPLPEAFEWLNYCSEVFGEENIFILSNKPTEERRIWFATHFSKIRFISGVRKKPFPDGLHEIMNLSGIQLSKVLMVDDRLLTGCLAAINAGAKPCYIRKPYISLKHRPLSEAFFTMLRMIERCYINICNLL